MSDEKIVKDLMIPLENYPHIPYWFTLNQAVIIAREAAIKFEGSFEPRAVLDFDEKYNLYMQALGGNEIQPYKCDPWKIF